MYSPTDGSERLDYCSSSVKVAGGRDDRDKGTWFTTDSKRYVVLTNVRKRTNFTDVLEDPKFFARVMSVMGVCCLFLYIMVANGRWKEVGGEMDRRENTVHELLLLYAPGIQGCHHLISSLLDPSASPILFPSAILLLLGYVMRGMEGKSSRGYVATSYMESGLNPGDYARMFVRHMRGSRFGPFNAIIGDENGAVYLTNRGTNSGGAGAGDGEGYVEVRELEKGRVYGLSNAGLDTPWGKVERGRQMFEDRIREMGCGRRGMGRRVGRGEGVEGIVEEVMGDDEVCKEAVTGCSREMER